MDWILWIIPPFPIKHQKEDDDDDDCVDDGVDDDDDDDSLEVWSNVRVGGNMFNLMKRRNPMSNKLTKKQCYTSISHKVF